MTSRNRHRSISAITILCVLCVSAVSISLAQEWTQWRGPDRNATVMPKGLAQSWPSSLKSVWKAKTGIGFASLVGRENKIYAFYLEGDQDVLTCIDADSGKPLWKQSYGSAYTGAYKGTRSSPIIEGDRIYTYGGNGQLVGRNLADGKQLWMVNVLQETGGKNKQWGMASNPLLDGEFLYMQAGEGGNAAACVDKKSGKIVWKSQAKDGGYAPPVMVGTGADRVLVCFGHEKLVGMDPRTGKTLWTLNEAWETQYNINAAMPVVQGNQIFVSVAYSNGHSGLYDVSASGIKQVWGGKQATCRFQPPILDNGYLYANSEGILKCISWADGKVMWATPNNEKAMLGMGGSIVRFGDKLICLSERGKLTLVQATPEAYKKISEIRSTVEGKQVWSTPLVHQGKLYLKGEDEIACYDISIK